MEKTLEIETVSSPEGGTYRVLIPSEKRIARHRFEAERASERAEELRSALETASDEEKKKLRERLALETQREELNLSMAREMETARTRAMAEGQVEAWTYTLPDLGWTADQEAEAGEKALTWLDDLTPRRDETRYRNALLNLCVGEVRGPGEQKIPILEAPNDWRMTVWEELRAVSEPTFDLAVFFRWWSRTGTTVSN